MTTPTFTSATDELLGLFKAAWDANAPAANGGDPVPVLWPGAKDDPPNPAGPYARIRVRHTTSRQSTFGRSGERRFTRPGLVTVQVFAPMVEGGGLTLAENLAIIARDAYEGRGTDSGIWFRRTAVQDVGADGSWHQFNVVVEFEYDEIK